MKVITLIFVGMCLVFLQACSNGGSVTTIDDFDPDRPGATPNPPMPSLPNFSGNTEISQGLNVIFPSPFSNVGDVIETLITLKIQSPQIDEALLGRVERIVANDIELENMGDFWQGAVLIQRNTNNQPNFVEVTAFTEDGESGTRRFILYNSIDARAGAALAETQLLSAYSLFEFEGRIFVSDSFRGSVHSIDLFWGFREPIFESNQVNARSDDLFWRISFNNDTNALFILEDSLLEDGTKRTVLSEIDLTSNQRSIISDTDDGNGVNLFSPRSLQIDFSTGIAYILDDNNNTRAVIQVDLTTGRRRGLDPDVIGEASLASELGLRDMVLDIDNNRLIVLREFELENQRGDPSLIEMDLEGIEQKILMSLSDDNGQTIDNPAAMALNKNGDVVYVIGNQTIWRVDLIQRTLERISSSFPTQELGNGAFFNNNIRSLILNDNENVLYAATRLGEVIAVNIQTGDRVVIHSEQAATTLSEEPTFQQ